RRGQRVRPGKGAPTEQYGPVRACGQRPLKRLLRRGNAHAQHGDLPAQPLFQAHGLFQRVGVEGVQNRGHALADDRAGHGVEPLLARGGHLFYAHHDLHRSTSVSTLHGPRMFSGSSCRLSAQSLRIFSSPYMISASLRLILPAPCSAVMVPPMSLTSRAHFSNSACPRRYSSRLRASTFGCTWFSPMWPKMRQGSPLAARSRL